MRLGLLGTKKGVTQVFDAEGCLVPVTVIQTGPCTVVQTKTEKSDGYNSIQVGFGEVQEKRLSRAQKGHFAKKKLKPFRHLKEFRVKNGETFQVGQVMTVEVFQPGEHVCIEGVTKGRGFQGVIKKEGKQGGPKSHGSCFHRQTGSIGQNSWPSRVFKNMGMPGRMGNKQVLTENLEVIDVKKEEGLLLVKGAVPGTREGLVVVYGKVKDFAERFKKEEAAKEESPKAEAKNETKTEESVLQEDLGEKKV